MWWGFGENGFRAIWLAVIPERLNNRETQHHWPWQNTLLSSETPTEIDSVLSHYRFSSSFFFFFVIACFHASIIKEHTHSFWEPGMSVYTQSCHLLRCEHLVHIQIIFKLTGVVRTATLLVSGQKYVQYLSVGPQSNLIIRCAIIIIAENSVLTGAKHRVCLLFLLQLLITVIGGASCCCYAVRICSGQMYFGSRFHLTRLNFPHVCFKQSSGPYQASVQMKLCSFVWWRGANGSRNKHVRALVKELNEILQCNATSCRKQCVA